MTFRGFPAEAFEFFEGLEADNTKAYWTDHKADYEKHVREPFQALLDDLAPAFGEGHLMRPYRDVRFSADKSPYKTWAAAGMANGPYIQLNAEGLGVGIGYYMMATDQLERFRRSIDDDKSGRALANVVAGIRKKKIEVAAHDEPLKTAPRGYPKDHPRIELLRMKGIVAWKQWPAAPALGTKAVTTRIVEFVDNARPLVKWLDAHVGPSTLPMDGRR